MFHCMPKGHRNATLFGKSLRFMIGVFISRASLVPSVNTVVTLLSTFHIAHAICKYLTKDFHDLWY